MTANAPYEVGDFPTMCPSCGMSYWGTHHECHRWYTVPYQPYRVPAVTTNTTVDGSLMLAMAINRLAAALEALAARYDVAGEDDEDEER